MKEIVGSALFFNKVYKNKSYSFEVHALFGEKDTIKIRIECARDIIFINFVSKHKYFSVTPGGEVKDIQAEDYWD